MRRNGLITGLVVLLGIVLLTRLAVQFGVPAFLRAAVDPGSSSNSNIVGTHAAFFDVGGNIKIAELVKSKSNNKNLMITVNVSIGASASDISAVVGATNGLTPIIRIVGVDASTTLGDATGIAQKLGTVSLPPNTLVVFGNELNNLQKEWKSCPGGCAHDNGKVNEAGSLYDALFGAFQGAATNFTAVPAPPDMYNGDYDWKYFVHDSTGANRPAYRGKLVANSYDLTDEGGPGNSLYTALGNVVAFTEYGPNPKKSLQEHINFFKAHPPVLPATTLIPDKCKSSDAGSDQWLFYVDGKIYDASGNEIDPATCDKGKGHAGEPPAGEYYKRFVYPFYSENSTVDDIKKKLEADYTVACANPANYGTQVDGSVKEMIQYQSSSCKNALNPTACLFSPEAMLTIDATGKNRLFGVLRNENDVKWRAYDASLPANAGKRSFTNRFESVEQWFGANNPPEGAAVGQSDYSNQTPNQINPLHQGPYYKLTPLLMQCKAAGEVLKASSDLCTEWSALPENAGQKCNLTERLVPGTNKTYGEVQKEVISNSGSFDSFCNAVYDPISPNSVPEGQKSIAADVSKVDLYMETAYRPAFLVLTTIVDPINPPIGQGNPKQKFTTKGQESIQGNQVVDFLVYHVPDTITDIKDGTNGATDDILTRTAKTFISQETTDKFVQDYQAKRAGIAAPLYAPPAKGPIDCHGGVCEEKLRRALIDFINAYQIAKPDGESINCKEPDTSPAESGTRIGSELAPNDTPDNLKKTLKNGAPIDSAKVEGRMDEYIQPDGSNTIIQQKEPTAIAQTFMYNVAPYGMKTEYVAEAFDALFATSQQNGQFKENDKYLTSFEAIFGNTLDSKPDIVGYTVPRLAADGVTPLLDDQGNPLYDQKTVQDELKMNGHPPFSAKVPWLAKVFNLSTRGIVQQISSTGQNLLECARAVTDPTKNTEDFLLHCQTRGNSVGAPSPDSPNTPAIGFASFGIESWDSNICKSFNPPSAEVWSALQAADQKHKCDSKLLAAIAFSESGFNTLAVNSGSGATGLFQFMDTPTIDTWATWWRAGSHQQSSFIQKDPSGKFDCTHTGSQQCNRNNPYASADAACRLVNWTGMNKYYDDKQNFIRAFSIKGDNSYGQVWNVHQPHADFVWRLWHALNAKDEASREEFLTINPSADAQKVCPYTPSSSTVPDNTGVSPIVTQQPNSTPASTCGTGQTCMSSAACGLISGTPGSSCGNGNICCSSTAPVPTQSSSSNSCTTAGGSCTDGPGCLLAGGTISTTGSCSSPQVCCKTP